MKVRRITWVKFFARGQHPMIVNDLCQHSFRWYKTSLKIPAPTAYKRNIATYFDRDELKKITDTITAQIKNNPRLFQKRVENARTVFRPLLTAASHYGKIQWHTRSRAEIFKAIEHLYALYEKTYIYIYWPLWIDDAALPLVRNDFRKRFGREWEEYYRDATRPLTPTSAQKYRSQLLAVASVAQKKKLPLTELRKNAKKLAEQFGYLKNYLFRYSPLSTDEILNELHLNAQKETIKDLKRVQMELQQKKNQKMAIYHQMPASTQAILNTVSATVFLRDERIAWYGNALSGAYPLFQAAAKTLGLTYAQFTALTIEEVLQQSVDRSAIAARLKGYEYKMIGDTITITAPLGVHKNTSRRTTKVQGVVAQRGIVRGTVRLGNAYTFKRVKPGEVVVTGMTTPDSIPYVRHAAAIVTDEGGITAHAALIAREFKIPCIVGTKIATKIFKDGDIVEVDADRGVVRKV